jgi:hypothetical protein
MEARPRTGPPDRAAPSRYDGQESEASHLRPTSDLVLSVGAGKLAAVVEDSNGNVLGFLQR